MKRYAEMAQGELEAERQVVRGRYEELKGRKLSLNMARGKPGRAQLDMVSGIFDVLRSDSDFTVDGMDVRNYGGLEGLPSARKLFAELLGVLPSQVLMGGSASLQLMYDAISKAFTHGLLHSERPWSREPEVKWLCPAPGYDRHFRISETFGMTMIPIPMTPIKHTTAQTQVE